MDMVNVTKNCQYEIRLSISFYTFVPFGVHYFCSCCFIYLFFFFLSVFIRRIFVVLLGRVGRLLVGLLICVRCLSQDFCKTLKRDGTVPAEDIRYARLFYQWYIPIQPFDMTGMATCLLDQNLRTSCMDVRWLWAYCGCAVHKNV